MCTTTFTFQVPLCSPKQKDLLGSKIITKNVLLFKDRAVPDIHIYLFFPSRPLSSLYFSPSLPVVTQIRGHIAGTPPPPTPYYGACRHSYFEKSSYEFSSLAYSRACRAIQTLFIEATAHDQYLCRTSEVLLPHPVG